jgi:hypothetical protein
MIRSLVSATSSLAAVLLLASSASAQSTPRTPGGGTDRLMASAADTTPPRGKAVAPASVTFAQLSAAMGALPEQSSRFVRVRGLRAEHITLVDVRNLFRYTDDQKSYEQALMQHERHITTMRSTLQNSLVLRDLLYDRGLNMSQVIGVQTTADGRAIVFYQPE